MQRRGFGYGLIKKNPSTFDIGYSLFIIQDERFSNPGNAAGVLFSDTGLTYIRDEVRSSEKLDVN